MAQINTDSPFVSYNLTSEEESASHILSANVVYKLQNKLCMAACAKNNTPLDPEHVERYMYVEAVLRGKMEILQEILDEHFNTVKEVQQQQSSQHPD